MTATEHHFAHLPSTLTAARQGDVAILKLNRPDKRNALDDETVHGIEMFFSGLPNDIKAAVIHGEGQHFSAGLDLNHLAEASLVAGVEHSRLWHRAFEKIEFGKVPVVAVLHGAVIGGGLELATAAHIRVAETTAYYALPEGSRGIYVGGGGSVRLPKLIGVSRMMDMMLTGRSYDAAEGQSIGLSHYVVEPGEGLNKGIGIAHRIAENAPLTNYAVTHVLPRIAGSDPASGYLAESMISAIAQESDEAKKRLKDFLEKRAKKTTHE